MKTKRNKKFRKTGWAVIGVWKGRPTCLFSTINYTKDAAIAELKYSNIHSNRVCKVEIKEI
jgi:hypothetical protein